MSTIINNLEELKDNFVPEEEAQQENKEETPAVPEQKVSLKDRLYERHVNAMQKAIDKKTAKLEAYQAKKLAKEEPKSEKTKLSKGKIVAGAAIGLGIVGAVGKALMDCAARHSDGICEENAECENTAEAPTEPVQTEESES